MAIHPEDLTARKLLASLKLQTGASRGGRPDPRESIAEAPDSVDAHVQLATAYYRLKRKEDGDREREIVDRLNAEIRRSSPRGKARAAPARHTPAPQARQEGPRSDDGAARWLAA